MAVLFLESIVPSEGIASLSLENGSKFLQGPAYAFLGRIFAGLQCLSDLAMITLFEESEDDGRSVGCIQSVDGVIEFGGERLPGGRIVCGD